MATQLAGVARCGRPRPQSLARTHLGCFAFAQLLRAPSLKFGGGALARIGLDDHRRQPVGDTDIDRAIPPRRPGRRSVGPRTRDGTTPALGGARDQVEVTVAPYVRRRADQLREQSEIGQTLQCERRRGVDVVAPRWRPEWSEVPEFVQAFPYCGGILGEVLVFGQLSHRAHQLGERREYRQPSGLDHRTIGLADIHGSDPGGGAFPGDSAVGHWLDGIRRCGLTCVGTLP